MKKIMSTAICLLIVLATLFSFAGCGEIVKHEIGDDLVKNGSFESAEALANWEVVAPDGSIVDTATHSGSDQISKYGNTYLRIKNNAFNRAYVKQTIQVEPNAVYKVSAVLHLPSATSGASTDSKYEGAYLGFDDNVKLIAKTSKKKATTNAWSGVYSFYVTTEFREVTLTVNLGANGGEAKGTVYFDSIEMIKVDPASVNSEDIATLGIFVPEDGGLTGILYVALGAVLVLVVGYFIYLLIRRHGYLNAGDDGSRHGFIANVLRGKGVIFAVIGVAIIARLLLSYFYTGHPTYMNAWGKIASNLTANNLSINSLTNNGVVAMPLYGYILWGLAQLETALGLVGGWATLLYRLPALVADCVIIVFLYKLAKRFIGQVGGVVAGLLWAVLPTVLTATSNWGAMDSLFALCALLTFYFIVNINSLTNGKRFTGIFVSLVAGVLIKIEMLWFVPLVAAFLIYNFVKKADTRKAIIIGSIASIVAFYVLSIPFCLNYITNGRPFYIWEFYYATLTKGLQYSMDNFGLYALVGLNYKSVNSVSTWMNLAFAALLFAFTLIVYFMNKSRVEIMLIAGFTMLAASTFAVDMTPTLAIAGIALILAYAFIANEKRVYWSAIGFALLNFLNIALILNFSGTLTPMIAGEVVKLTDSAWLIVMSVLQMIAVFYLLYLVYDICINDKIKQILYLEGRPKK